MNVFDQLLQSQDTQLPTLPSIAADIVQMANDPMPDVKRLTNTIAMDPALTSKVLRFVNSPLYAKQRQVENLQHAIVIIGLNATISLALSFSLLESLKDQEGQGIDYAYFWRRSLLAATSAKVLGASIGETAVEELFLAALLQDIGILALDKIRPGFYGKLTGEQQAHTALVEYEMSELDGEDHSQFGAKLLEEWQLPGRTVLAVRASHDTNQVADAELPGRFTACIKLSGIIADVFLLANGDEHYQSLYEQARDLLKISEQEIDRVLNQLADLIPSIEGTFQTSLISGQSPQQILEKARETLVRRSLEAMMKVDELQGVADRLKETSERDGLTGIYNRGYLDQQLEACFRQASLHNEPLSLAFIDLDYFKKVNDTYGHAAGDQVLKAVAQLLTKCVRKNDIVGRYGGEEFVIILNNAEKRDALGVCQRALEELRSVRHQITPSQGISVTASIGVATYDSKQHFDSFFDFVKAADTCVYASKAKGRDRLTFYGENAKPKN